MELHDTEYVNKNKVKDHKTSPSSFSTTMCVIPKTISDMEVNVHPLRSDISATFNRPLPFLV